MAADRRRDTWIDPVAGRTLFAEWVGRWLAALDLEERTIESYRSRLSCHILPRFGATPLAAITTLDITLGAKALAERYAPTTISSLINLLSMILADAADQHLIPANPIHSAAGDARAGSPAKESGPPRTRSSASLNKPGCSAVESPTY